RAIASPTMLTVLPTPPLRLSKLSVALSVSTLALLPHAGWTRGHDSTGLRNAITLVFLASGRYNLTKYSHPRARMPVPGLSRYGTVVEVDADEPGVRGRVGPRSEERRVGKECRTRGAGVA